MKPIFCKHHILIIAATFFVPAAFAQSGGGFDLSWSTIDGGGGASSGGVFALSGTIGQLDAGSLSGGPFTLGGGFWAITLPDRPRLRIRLAGADVVLSWPDPSTGFELQEAAGLPSSWTPVSQTPSVVNGEKHVSQSHSPERRFYRLVKP